MFTVAGNDGKCIGNKFILVELRNQNLSLNFSTKI